MQPVQQLQQVKQTNEATTERILFFFPNSDNSNFFVLSHLSSPTSSTEADIHISQIPIQYLCCFWRAIFKFAVQACIRLRFVCTTLTLLVFTTSLHFSNYSTCTTMGLSSTINPNLSSKGILSAASTRSYNRSKPVVTKTKRRESTANTITNKKIRFHSSSCVDVTEQESVFHKLDPTVPHQAHKMQQRRKAIAKGKNTVGYDEYCRRVPKDQRQKRSMETPFTPDPTRDIPNKKWNGMVKAWYVGECMVLLDGFPQHQVSSKQVGFSFSLPRK
jgi:hypothetical protein